MFFGSFRLVMCRVWLIFSVFRFILMNFGRLVGRYDILMLFRMWFMMLWFSFMFGVVFWFRKCSGILMWIFFLVDMCWKLMCRISCLNGCSWKLCSSVFFILLVILMLRIDEWKVFFFSVWYSVL